MRLGAPVLALACVLASVQCARARYWGQPLGALSELQHGVRGHVYAVDARTLFIKDFHYDGQGPAAYFIVGNSAAPSSENTRLRDERGGAGPLRAYRGEGVTLSLPEGSSLKDVRYLSVWCDEYAVNFGHVSIPRDLSYPRPARLGSLRGVHGVSSDPVVVVDAQTILVPNFSYDGEAPDAKFWVGRGEKPSPQGVRIPDENGKEAPLRKYDRKTIVLTLPGELTVFDIGHFGVWCEAFTVDFGHVEINPTRVANVPPSLKMLGVSPQSKLNCEVLLDELAFEVRWAVAGDSIVIQLVAKLEDGEYMSFGVSGSPTQSAMVGADVAVAWVDKGTLKGYAVDYYLDAKSQCAGVRGSCPDERLGEKTNSIRLLNAALVNGYSIVTYQRPLAAADELDRAILTNASQPIVWALGPLNARQEVSYHHHFTKGDKLLEFGRPPVWNCPMPEADDEQHSSSSSTATSTAPPRTAKPVAEVTTQKQLAIKPHRVPAPAPAPKAEPWDIPPIQCYEPPDGVFYAQMGPTGGKQGYPAITGHVGWGISWYINGLLIPELTLVRGRKYTFVVEGGSNPDAPAKYHPFYITNDPVGGYFHKSKEEKKRRTVTVRRARSGEVIPTGVGRLCSWTADPDAVADDFPSFGAYQRALTLVCEEGNPGVVTWTPDHNTPDTVYYQCFTHRHLGWKIHVVDECDVEGEGAESRSELVAAAPEDLQPQESDQVETHLPPPNALDQRKSPKIINTKHNYNDFSRQKPEEIYGAEPEAPVSAEQIYDVIKAVEGLESSARHKPAPSGDRPSYQVHEEPESHNQPGPVQENLFLPSEQKPHTLQSVLKPHNRPKPNVRPPLRRPPPPEFNFRRPPSPQLNQKHNYPLQMPGHSLYNQQRKHYGKPQGKRPPLMFPPLVNVPPIKAFHQHPKISFHQGPKHVPSHPSEPIQSIIMGKPVNNLPRPQSQTLSVGRTDLIANQIVKSQITLPAADSVPSSSVQTYVNQPGQIILGKPMDHPIPLDQQMMQTIHRHNTQATNATEPFSDEENKRFQELIQSTNIQYKPPSEPSNIKSSDFIGEHTETSSLPPAVNTGFKPNTIVIESGFKPIIRELLLERLADYDSNNNRREDTDIEENDYQDYQPTIPNNFINKLPSEKLTESFEPMFIPSPLDTMQPTNEIVPLTNVLPNAAVTKDVFPKNHAKEHRPHPVYIRTESELNALFSKKNMDKDVPSDMMMESDRISPQYLPPDPKRPMESSHTLTLKPIEQSQKLNLKGDQTFTTYDGKIVSAATLTSVSDVSDLSVPPKIVPSKHRTNTVLLLKTPQFGPFRGEIPPLESLVVETQEDQKAQEETKHKQVNVIKPVSKDDTSEMESQDTKVKPAQKIDLDNDDASKVKEKETSNDKNKKINTDYGNDEMAEEMDEIDLDLMDQTRKNWLNGNIRRRRRRQH